MLRTLRTGFLFTGLALLLATGCGHKIKECKAGVVYKPSDVVARVNGQTMVWDQLEKRARNYLKEEVESNKIFIPSSGEEKALEFYRRKALTLFVNKTVLVDEAKRLHIEVSATERQKIVMEMESLLKERHLATSLDDFFKKSPLGEKETRREFEDGLLVDKVIQGSVRDKIAITDADREALAGEIIAKRKDAKNKADELRRKLQKGADFAMMMKECAAEDDKRIVAGDLGELQRGKVPDKAIEDAAFTQKLNEIGPVIEANRGYMVLKVTAHTAAKAAAGTTPAVPETAHVSSICVRMPPMLKSADMDRVVQGRKFDKSVMEFLKALRAKAQIETIYKDLAF